MADPEKQQLLQALELGSIALAEALDGVDERLAVCQPEESGRWSILECVEHLAVSERLLPIRLTAATRSAESHANPSREMRIMDRGLDRSLKAKSPTKGLPRARFATLDAAVSAFQEARSETIRFVESSGDDLRSWTPDHPLIPGPVNCHEVLLLIAIHPIRHANRLLEIRDAFAASPQ